MTAMLTRHQQSCRAAGIMPSDTSPFVDALYSGRRRAASRPRSPSRRPAKGPAWRARNYRCPRVMWETDFFVVARRRPLPFMKTAKLTTR